MLNLTSYDRQLPSDREWKEGDFCVARYTMDHKWYRARIERSNEGLFEVNGSLWSSYDLTLYIELRKQQIF
jgi:hypothetical protein